jgi:arylformamidase
MAVWPGDPPVEEEALARIAAGDTVNVSRFRLGSHTGTHVDPPLHFLNGGAGVDAMSLDALCGECVVVSFDGPGHVGRGDMEALVPPGTERLLLRTPNSAEDPAVFHEGFRALQPDAAEWLVERGVALLGIDGPSVDPFRMSGFAAHYTLLTAGVAIVENLALAHVEPGRYEMVCAPLPWRGGDGSPARVLLRKTP